MTAGLASATLGLAASPAQALTQFAGDYAPTNWTQSIGGDGSIDTSGAPVSIILRGSDDSSGGQNTDFTIAAPTAGTVSFAWNYSTAELNSAYDVFGYLLNGAFTQLTLNGITNQSGTTSFSVLTGDVFGFRQNTQDSLFGRASTTISNFNGPTAPASVPGPLPILGVGATFAYSRRLRRRINLAKSPVSTDSVAVEQL
ncbi:MAG: PEP-CTERM sorting domain-containing protein [Cyanobacteria bacterium]|nr:PEP-CTERM sorting domain-containing protein [Cyanobacteria bacterium bin.275]